MIFGILTLFELIRYCNSVISFFGCLPDIYPRSNHRRLRFEMGRALNTALVYVGGKYCAAQFPTWKFHLREIDFARSFSVILEGSCCERAASRRKIRVFPNDNVTEAASSKKLPNGGLVACQDQLVRNVKFTTRIAEKTSPETLHLGIRGPYRHPLLYTTRSEYSRFLRFRND